MLWDNALAALAVRFDNSGVFAPNADLTVSDSDLVLMIDLPGLTAEDLSIEVCDDHLTVHGERARQALADGASYVYAQRPFGTFEYRLELPAGVDADAITADMQHGVLSLIIPKPEAVKPKRIRIDAGSEQPQLVASDG